MQRDHTSFSAKWSLDNLMLGCLYQPRIVHQRVSRWHTDRSIPPRCDAIFLPLLPLVAATLDLGLIGVYASGQSLRQSRHTFWQSTAVVSVTGSGTTATVTTSDTPGAQTTPGH